MRTIKYFICALYQEALPLIKKLNLSRDMTNHKFQVFCSRDTVLAVSSPGILNAAAVLSAMLVKYPPSSGNYADSIVINIGCCGCCDPGIAPGSCFLCNKIKDSTTGRAFYPDIVLRHDFEENAIETFPLPVSDSSVPSLPLVDMEAGAVFQTANIYLGPHQILVFKVVSDHCDSHRAVTGEFISGLVEGVADDVIKYSAELEIFLQERTQPQRELDEILDKVSQRLCLSVALKQLLKKEMSGREPDILHGYIKELDESAAVINNKREGKVYFEKLLQYIRKGVY